MNNKLTKAIELAIQQCKTREKTRGSSIEISLFDAYDTTVSAEWEEWEVDSSYDIITIYIKQGGILKLNFSIESTKIKK